MASDPAFLFYPGDYLRDTQCLSEVVQVAYDRIMCEHMRNICISHQQLKFFTKRMSSDEIEELKSVLTENSEGFFIKWVAESINKRKAYSESRRENRSKKNTKHINNISKTYVQHMENEIENENINDNKIKERKKNFKKPSIEELIEFFKSKGSTELESQKFFNYYESNGWKVGKNKMQSWSHAASGWISRSDNLTKRNVELRNSSKYLDAAEAYNQELMKQGNC